MKRKLTIVLLSALCVVLIPGAYAQSGGGSAGGGGSGGGSNGGQKSAGARPDGTTSVGGGIGTGTGSAPAPAHKKGSSTNAHDDSSAKSNGTAQAKP